LALAFFTGMVAAITAEQRPLSRQFDWPFSPEYPLNPNFTFVMFDETKLTDSLRPVPLTSSVIN